MQINATTFKKDVTSKRSQKRRVIFSFKARIEPIVLSLSSAFANESGSVLNTLIIKSFSHLETVLARGIPFTLKYIKESRNLVLRYLGGEPLSKSAYVEIMKGPNLGFPKWLSGWLPFIDSSHSDHKVHLRILMTILVSMRHFKLPKELNLGTIESESAADVGSISDNEILLALRFLKVRVRSDFPEWSSYHMTVKKGPAGPALLTSVSELTFLPSELLQYIEAIGGSKLSSYINDLQDRLDITKWQSVASVLRGYFPVKSERLRKLSYFSDKEGKTRVIALLDYWTQTALKPLHDELNRVLRGIKSDCTFNQGHFVDFLPKGNSVTYHSIDLSAATDRMPLALQKRVLGLLFSNLAKADVWGTMLSGFPFDVVLPDKSSRSIFYRAGQPMGAYSSWPAMALTHHIIVQIAAIRGGFRFFSDYCILGDDLVICNDVVAFNYKQLLVTLDMPFSPEKTHTSKDVFEFAKRWFYQGSEITGFSVGGYLKVWKKYSLLSSFLRNQQEHGWIFPSDCAVLSLVKKLQRTFQGDKFVSEHFHRTYKLFLLFHKLIAFKMNPTKELGREFVSVLESNFPAIHPSWMDLFNTDPQEGLRNLLIQSKMSLANKDLAKFQSDLYVFNDQLNSNVQSEIKRAWSDSDSNTKDFLVETLSVVLNWATPVVHVLNKLIDNSIEYLTQTHFCDAEIGPNYQLILTEGLGKYMITKRMFSMKPSDSKILAEAAIIKSLLEIGTQEMKQTPSMILEASPPMCSGLDLLSIRKYIGPSSILLRYFDFISGCLFMLCILHLTGLLLPAEVVEATVIHSHGLPETLHDFSCSVKGHIIDSMDLTSEPVNDPPLASDFQAVVFIVYSMGVILLLLGYEPSSSCVGDLIDLATPIELVSPNNFL